MFNAPTVIVIGAGASAEVNLPVGIDLAKEIRRKLDVRFSQGQSIGQGDMSLYNSLRACAPFAQGGENLNAAAVLIRDGILMTDSVDDFLERHQENTGVKVCAKAAIIHSILEKENSSHLQYDTSNIYNKMDAAKLEGSWYLKFMRMLGRGVAKSQVDKIFNNVAFIVFNYDRCLEHFLLNALPPPLTELLRITLWSLFRKGLFFIPTAPWANCGARLVCRLDVAAREQTAHFCLNV